MDTTGEAHLHLRQLKELMDGIGEIIPSKSSSTVDDKTRKRAIQNKNNADPPKRPKKTYKAFGTEGSSRITIQYGISDGARLPKDTSTTLNNTYQTPCWNCKKIVLRGPTPHHIDLRDFCSIECGREWTQNGKGFINPSLLTPIFEKKVKKSATRPSPCTAVGGLKKQIQQIGKEISRAHRQALGDDDPDDLSDLEEEPKPDLKSLKKGFSNYDSSSSSHSDFVVPPKKTRKEEHPSFDWMDWLKKPDFNAASVSLIKHASLAQMWEVWVTLGIKLEVENTDAGYLLMEKTFWVASVINIQGYYVQLRYEGFGNDARADFWIHLTSPSVHHIGWSAENNKPLIPPMAIAKKYSDWRNFLVNRLTGNRSLPSNFREKIDFGNKSKYKINDRLEVVDKFNISQLKVATIKKIIGKRLHVEYFDSSEDGGFWCHYESRMIYPSGWALSTGHKISSPPDYDPPMLPDSQYNAVYETMNLKVGMKLEAIDPLNLAEICTATIMQVLKRGYVMVRVDCYEEESDGTDWFCYHICSPYVLPCGFCNSNGIPLTPPFDYDQVTFTWDQYLKETNSVPAPVKVKALSHKFAVGMKVEVVDLVDPRLICVATICQVVGRLLKIHFEGWDDEYDQWMDSTSPDIYPIGWCQMVNYRLETPPCAIPVQQPKSTKSKKKERIGSRKGGRAKKTLVTVEKKTPDRKSTTMNQKVKKSTAVNETVATSTSQKPDESLDLTTSPVTAASMMSELFPVNKVEVASTDVPGTFNNMKLQESISEMLDDNIPKALENPESMKPVEPVTWSIQEVADFLTSHDYGSYCEGFIKNDIDGETLMMLTKDQVVLLTGMKVGPAVKIYDLICQLKICASEKSALLK